MSWIRTLMVAMAIAVAVSGCQTAVRGTSQSIPVGSTPEGAECIFMRDGQPVAMVVTPGSITVKRDRKPINVVCTKAGHEEARAVLNSQTDSYGPSIPTSVVGAVLTIGNLADAASGANNRYQTTLMMKLEPMSAADLAAAATRPQPPPPSAPPVAAAAVATPPAGAPPSPPPPSPPLQTGSWKARNVLIPERSLTSCSRDGGDYSLDVSGDTFTVDNRNGRMLVVTLPADGRIDEAFHSPSGARLAIVGNARTRELEIVNVIGCRWKLAPQS
jgi:hypothetical protein